MYQKWLNVRQFSRTKTIKFGHSFSFEKSIEILTKIKGCFTAYRLLWENFMTSYSPRHSLKALKILNFDCKILLATEKSTVKVEIDNIWDLMSKSLDKAWIGVCYCQRLFGQVPEKGWKYLYLRWKIMTEKKPILIKWYTHRWLIKTFTA